MYVLWYLMTFFLFDLFSCKLLFLYLSCNGFVYVLISVVGATSLAQGPRVDIPDTRIIIRCVLLEWDYSKIF